MSEIPRKHNLISTSFTSILSEDFDVNRHTNCLDWKQCVTEITFRNTMKSAKSIPRPYQELDMWYQMRWWRACSTSPWNLWFHVRSLNRQYQSFFYLAISALQNNLDNQQLYKSMVPRLR